MTSTLLCGPCVIVCEIAYKSLPCTLMSQYLPIDPSSRGFTQRMLKLMFFEKLLYVTEAVVPV